MMTDTLRDRIAVVLESEGLTQLGALSVANVVIRELSLRSGIAVVELPEPDYEDSTGHGWNGDSAGGVYAHGGKVYDEEGRHTPAQARAVAANWLAAADYAEKESKETQ